MMMYKKLYRCESQGHEAAAEFAEATTGTDDKRPAFQQMAERAREGDNAFAACEYTEIYTGV